MVSRVKETGALQCIDRWLGYRSRFSQLPGFQLCIRNKGQAIFNKAYGYANLSTQRALTTENLFRIASHSKTFTSCGILQLRDRGLLHLHQSVLDFIPQLAKHKDKRFKQITIRDLLSHRAGIFRDGTDSDFWDLQKPFLSKEQLLQEIMASELIFTPNECSKYSNFGFSLLGLVIEQILQVPYAQAMDSLVIQKLKETNILPDYTDNSEKSFADGHSRPLFERQSLPLKHSAARAMAPAAGFCANAADTNLFFHHFLVGKEFISGETQRELLTLNWPIKNSTFERYGLGLQFERLSDLEFIGHSGAYPGFSTYTANWVGTNYVISFFLNTNDIFTHNVIKSIVKLINLINATFTDREASSITVSDPLMNKWGGLLFVQTKTKGLCFQLDTWDLCDTTLHLSSKNGEDYFCDQQSGYQSLGEKINFKKDIHNNIVSVKWGSYMLMQEALFLDRFKTALM